MRAKFGSSAAQEEPAQESSSSEDESDSEEEEEEEEEADEEASASSSSSLPSFKPPKAIEWLQDFSEIQRRRDDNENKIFAFEGGGGPWGQRGQRGKSSKSAYFRGKRHDNKILKVQILLSRNFVVVAQAPRDCETCKPSRLGEGSKILWSSKMITY